VTHRARGECPRFRPRSHLTRHATLTSGLQLFPTLYFLRVYLFFTLKRPALVCVLSACHESPPLHERIIDRRPPSLYQPRSTYNTARNTARSTTLTTDPCFHPTNPRHTVLLTAHHPARYTPTTRMRPLRLLLALSTSLLAVVLLVVATLGSQQEEQFEQTTTKGRHANFRSRLSFTSPGSLFPPSAIISLTDDNSTFFLARPAAFGPELPKDGLSSSLWIGSGFGDDAMGMGELGCSDSRGWDMYTGRVKLEQKVAPTSSHKTRPLGAEKDAPPRGTVMDTTPGVSPDDGTDDYPRPSLSARHTPVKHNGQRTKHADIQSLQESAEIEGKVVLLKRGGCGFLAKVLWAQSRGAVAVIVGDDVRGGGLVRMYAKGDTSNVTISSLFTSHTTAQLLSSLLPPSGNSQGVLSGTAAPSEGLASGKDTTGEVKQDEKHKGKGRPTSSLGTSKSSPTSTPGTQLQKAPLAHKVDEQSWLYALLSMFSLGDGGNTSPKAGSRRPPSSGYPNWDEDRQLLKTRSDLAKPTHSSMSDAFVIGKQDWRDPDLVTASTPTGQHIPSATPTSKITKSSGGVLPGSGEYAHTNMLDREPKAWWKKWFGTDNHASAPRAKHANGRSITAIIDANLEKVETSSKSEDAHEGLWVTLTPTNGSTSPFFDTLLVLVVSPLVTLSVVYALLLLRSRIRRRRWRAPKSLVERLPVRTYQTISDSVSSATPSATSPTTPLLQNSSPPPTSPIPTPDSQAEHDAPAASSSFQPSSRSREEEKREAGLAEWRRRYGGRQRECVVCLEEYEAGVSQVMSLPCGHEFHAECMQVHHSSMWPTPLIELVLPGSLHVGEHVLYAKATWCALWPNRIMIAYHLCPQLAQQPAWTT
jgi:hypothetical protein